MSNLLINNIFSKKKYDESEAERSASVDNGGVGILTVNTTPRSISEKTAIKHNCSDLLQKTGSEPSNSKSFLISDDLKFTKGTFNSSTEFKSENGNSHGLDDYSIIPDSRIYFEISEPDRNLLFQNRNCASLLRLPEGAESNLGKSFLDTMINQDEESFWEDALNQVLDGKRVEVTCHLRQWDSRYANATLEGFLVSDSSKLLPKFTVWCGYVKTSDLVKPSEDEEQVFCRICESQIPMSIFEDHSFFCARYANCESNHTSIQQDVSSIDILISERVTQLESPGAALRLGLQEDTCANLLKIGESMKAICKVISEIELLSDINLGTSVDSMDQAGSFNNSPNLNDVTGSNSISLSATVDFSNFINFGKIEASSLASWKCPKYSNQMDRCGLMELGVALEKLIQEKVACMRNATDFMAKLSALSFVNSPHMRQVNSESYRIDSSEEINTEKSVAGAALALSGLTAGNGSEFGDFLQSISLNNQTHTPKSGTSTPDQNLHVTRANSVSISKTSMPSSPLLPSNRKISISSANMYQGGSSSVTSPLNNSIGIADFEVIKPISRGSYGRVYLARKKKTGDYYAIKVLNKADLIARNQLNQVLAEQNILSHLDSPFVVKMYYSFQSKNSLYLVLEYLNGGDCASLLKAVGRLDEDWARTYLAEIILGLEIVHRKGIIHRDLKPDNFLVDNKGHIKITDFGLSRLGMQDDTATICSPMSANFNLSSPTNSYFANPKSEELDLESSTSSTPSPRKLSSPDRPNASFAYFKTGAAASADQFGTAVSMERRSSLLENILSPGGRTNRRISEIRGVSPLRNPTSITTLSNGNVSLASMSNNDMRSSFSSNNNTTDDSDSDNNPATVGTPDYMAPELLNPGHLVNHLVDFWSLGVVAYEFLCGIPPFHDETPEKIFERIKAGKFEFPDEDEDDSSDMVLLVSDEAKDLIRSLLQLNPNDRLGATKSIKDHPFFSSIDWGTVQNKESVFVPRTEAIDDTAYFDDRGVKAFEIDEAEAGTGTGNDASSLVSNPGKVLEDFDTMPLGRLNLSSCGDSKISNNAAGSETGENADTNSEDSKSIYSSNNNPAYYHHPGFSTTASNSILSSMESFTYRNLTLLEKANSEALREKIRMSRSSNFLAKPRISLSVANGLKDIDISDKGNPGATIANDQNKDKAGISKSSNDMKKAEEPGSNGHCDRSSGSTAKDMHLVTSNEETSGGESTAKEMTNRQLDVSTSEKSICFTDQPVVTKSTESTQNAISGNATAQEKASHNPPPDPALKTQRPIADRKAAKSTPTHVLIVEDNPVSVIVLDAFLRKRNCKTCISRNGQEALREALDTRKFDLILMDVQLPGIMSGIQVARFIKASETGINRDTPIIATTGFADIDANGQTVFASSMASSATGVFDAVVHKPITLEKVDKILSAFPK